MRRRIVRVILFVSLLAAAGALPAATASAATGDVKLFSAQGAQPFDITTGPDGNLWFTAPSQGQIGRITPTGTVKLFDAGGTQPDGITFGPDGNVWFAAPSQGQIGRITPTGTVKLFDAGGTQPFDITTGPDGNLWFTAPSQSEVGKITTGGTVTVFAAGGQPFNIGSHDITAGPDGNVWYGLGGQDAIGRITPSGTVTVFGAGGTQPVTITAGPDGNLWFGAASQSSIGRITPSGTVTIFSAGGIQPFGITAGSGRSLWFTGPSQQEIGQISTSGVVTNTFSAAGTQPDGITSGPDGNIWFASPSQQEIGRLSTPPPAANASLGVWTSNGAGGWSFQNVTTATGGTSIANQAKPIIDGHGIIHVYASSPGGDLLEFIQGQPGQWTVNDLSRLVGGATIATDPKPLLLLGSAGVDIQVFALNSSGHLLSFVEGNANPGVWQVFDLTALSGSTATLTGDTGAIQVGNDLHIYATDTNGSLHDFVKAPTSNWMDVNLSAITGQAAQPAPVPFAYGGNSIQIAVLDGTHPNDMDTFIEGVRSDGSLTGSDGSFDITQLRGQDSNGNFTNVATFGSPLVFGSTNQNVGIYAGGAGSSTIFEFFKAPAANWTSDVVSVGWGTPGSGVAALLAGGQINIFSVDLNDHLQLFTTPVSNAGTGPWSNVDVTAASGAPAAALSVPTALFVPQTGQTMVFGDN